MDEQQIKEDVQQFNKEYAQLLNGETILPDTLAAAYDIVCCLSSHAYSETFMVRAKPDGKSFVLRVTEDKDGAGNAESDVLTELDHNCIPKLVASVSEGGKCFIVREYFDGQTLSDIMKPGRMFSDAETMSIAAQLCDILGYLHQRPKPIIYRDLKPHNIIISPDGIVRLIDFDIARRYDATASTDTQYYGTKEFSPPEQFGYAQTDARTDVYALGMLMLYMLTGRADLNAIHRVKNIALRKIIVTSTQFAPKDRLADMQKFKSRLNNAGKMSRRIRIKRAAGLVGLCVACIAAGFVLGRYVDTTQSPAMTEIYAATANVTFETPLIDEAVRLALAKGPNDTIEYQELATIETLQIWGDAAYQADEDMKLSYNKGFTDVEVYFGDYDGESHQVTRGNIVSLEEISLLKNLRRLDIVMQNIDDLSPIADLPLEELNIAGNAISDLSPLAGMNTLVHLNIDYNPVEDITPVAQLGNLVLFSASDTVIADVTPLGGLYHLEYLYINNARISDVSPLDKLQLVNCFLENNQITDASALNVTDMLSVEGNPAAG